VTELWGQPHFVTCYHVLFGIGGAAGDVVWALDPGTGARLGPIGRTVWGCAGRVTHRGKACFVDVAVGRLFDNTCVDGRLANVPRLDARAEVVRGHEVSKDGAVTGRTHGTVVDCAHYEAIQLDGRSRHAPGQLRIRPPRDEAFCAAGDSGATVLDANGHVVALLWGSSVEGTGCASPIEAVVARLREREAEIGRAGEELARRWGDAS
jgi:hypothetical protein